MFCIEILSHCYAYKSTRDVFHEFTKNYDHKIASNLVSTPSGSEKKVYKFSLKSNGAKFDYIFRKNIKNYDTKLISLHTQLNIFSYLIL